jgi:hypothetical protein
LISDGQYFVTVRALNEVKYGGPLATTVCHTTPYTVDDMICGQLKIKIFLNIFISK